MHKNKKVRTAISIMLSFFLAATVFVLYAAVLIKSGFLPGKAWQSYLSGSRYESRMAEEAQKQLSELLEEYGLPAGAAEGLIDQETLYADCSRWLDDCWKEDAQTSKWRENFEENLQEAVKDYLTEYQVKMSGQLKQEIRVMTDQAGRIYENALSPGWLMQMLEVKKNYDRMLSVAMIAGVLTAAVCMVLLWKLYHYKHRAVRFACVSVGTAFLWSALLLVFLKQSDWLEHANIAPAAYRELIQGVTDVGIRNGLLALGVELWILILLVLWMKRLKRSIK